MQRGYPPCQGLKQSVGGHEQTVGGLKQSMGTRRPPWPGPPAGREARRAATGTIHQVREGDTESTPEETSV